MAEVHINGSFQKAKLAILKDIEMKVNMAGDGIVSKTEFALLIVTGGKIKILFCKRFNK